MGDQKGNKKDRQEQMLHPLLEVQDMRAEEMLNKITNEMPGGFFVYHADGDEEIIYANIAMLRLFNCSTMEEFREWTGNSFKGIVHPEDLEEVERSIWQQIKESHYDLDYVEYRIIAKGGEVRWVEDYGHYIHSESAGDVFYVFAADATEKRKQREEEEKAMLSERLQKEQVLKKRIEEYGKELEEANEEQLRRMIVIEGLSSDYAAILYANLDENWIQPYRVSERIEYRFGREGRRSEFEGFDSEYIRTWVCAEDRELLAEAVRPENIRRRLAKSRAFSVNYRILIEGRLEYLQLRVIKAGKESDQVSEIIMGYRSVDEEILHEMERKTIAEDALGDARKANAAKDAFLANMSHDMRTPMNAVVGFTNLARRYAGDRERLEKYLDKISESSDRLLTLINDVLEISRMDTSEDELEEKECNLLDSVKEVRETMLPRAAAKNIEFSMDVSEVKHCEVYSDSEKLNRILERLGSNAIQYTEDGGKIVIAVKELEEIASGRASYQFVVQDNGIGMSKSFQKHMFEPFERQRNTTLSGVPGTGLGLTITKRIVEMMGGNIEVDSVEGEGSRFTVTLEFQIRQETADKSESESDVSALPYGQRKVLLVEDNELNLELEVELLRDEGFRVETAENGRIAVEKIKSSKPGEYGVVLMDIQMPVMDGYHAAREIRRLENPELSKIPIIAVSANTFDEDRRKAFECGMNAYVAKPVDVPVLLHAIGEAWGEFEK